MTRKFALLAVTMFAVGFILCFFILGVTSAGASQWTVNGVNVSRETFWQDTGAIAVGAFVSTAVHVASHSLYLEATNSEWHFDGLDEHFTFKNNDHAAWVGRSGFIGQLIVGSILNFIDSDSRFFTCFKSGYQTLAMLEVITYQLRRGENRANDFKLINRSGKPGIENFIYAGWSVYNYINQE